MITLIKIPTRETILIVNNYDGLYRTTKLHTKQSTLTTKNGGMQLIRFTTACSGTKACKLRINLYNQQHYYGENETKRNTSLKEVEKRK